MLKCCWTLFDVSGPIQGLSDRLPAGHKSEPGGAAMGPGLKPEPPQPAQQLVYVFTTSLANRWGVTRVSLHKSMSFMGSVAAATTCWLLILSAAPQRPWWKARPTPSSSFTSRTSHSPSWSRSDWQKHLKPETSHSVPAAANCGNDGLILSVVLLCPVSLPCGIEPL